MNKIKIAVLLLGLMIGLRVVAMDDLQQDIQDIKVEIAELLEKNKNNPILKDYSERFQELDRGAAPTRPLLSSLTMLKGDIKRLLGMQPARVVSTDTSNLARQNQLGLQSKKLQELKTSIKIHINQIGDPATQADLESQFDQVCQSQQESQAMFKSLKQFAKTIPSDDAGSDSIEHIGDQPDIDERAEDTDQSKKNLTLKMAFFRPRYLIIAAGCVSSAVLIYRYFRSEKTQEIQRDVEQPEQDEHEGAE